MDKSRRAYVSILYERKGKTLTTNQRKTVFEQMRKSTCSFMFTGNASGMADAIELVLSNQDRRWMKNWIPKKKDKITATIKTQYWKNGQKTKKEKCGTFMVDSFSFSLPEDNTCTVEGTSVPESSSFRATERNKKWKKVTLKEVSKRISKKYHMKLFFDGEDFSIGSPEQSGQSDCEFLTNICQSYGYGIKMYRGQLVIYDMAKYEKKAPRGTIYKHQMESFSWDTSMTGTYTGAKMKYTDSCGKDTTVKVGKGNRWLQINGDADSITQAKRMALGQLNTKNMSAITANITIQGNLNYSDTDTVKLAGLDKLSGKYFIDTVQHKVEAQGGFTTTLTLHRVTRRITG